MKEISEDLKNKALRYALVTVVVLIALIVAISCYRKQSRTVLDNSSSDLQNVQEKVIFDDIKIKINGDIFSYDQIHNEVKEKDIISYFNKNLKKGDTVLYISQDIGVQQLLIAKLASPSGRVYVLNPFEKYNDTIELSARANKFENRIFTETVAISDKSYDGLLVYKNDESPEYGTIESSDYKLQNGYNALKVKVTTLDELYPNLQNIDFLRIARKKDAAKAINGAQRIIKFSPKIKIVLDYEKNELSNSAVINNLKELGFKIYAIGEDGEVYPADMEKITGGHILLKRD